MSFFRMMFGFCPSPSANSRTVTGNLTARLFSATGGAPSAAGAAAGAGAGGAGGGAGGAALGFRASAAAGGAFFAAAGAAGAAAGAADLRRAFTDAACSSVREEEWDLTSIPIPERRASSSLFASLSDLASS